jgi:spermidine/putrescine transport system substrate-binding protein
MMQLRPPGISPEDAAFVERYQMSRAALLRRATVLAGAAMGLPLLRSADALASLVAAQTLNLLVWQGYDDAKAALPLKKKGVKINAQYVANNDEFITKLRGGGLGRYDIVTPYFGYIVPLVKANLITPIDYTMLPYSRAYIKQFYKPKWNTFNGQTYSAPLVWGDTPIVYRPDLLKKLPASWLDLRKPYYKGKVVMWDDGYGHILLFSKVIHGPAHPNLMTKSQLSDVVKVLKEIKKNAVTIAPSHGDAADIIARGDGALQTEGWAYVKALIEKKGKPAALYTPKEGSFVWCDSYCIARNAPHEDVAYQFINTMNSAKGQGIIGTDVASGVTNRQAIRYQSPDVRKLYRYTGTEAFFKKNGFYGIPPLTPTGKLTTLSDWNKAWENVKAS